MNQRKKKNIIIGVLCCLLVLMGVGYAVLSTTLTIDGTANISGEFDVYIESIEVKLTSGQGTSKSTSIGDDRLSATFVADLVKPGDAVVYDVEVANGGNIDAFLEDLRLSFETDEYLMVETKNIEVGDKLPAKSGSTPTTKKFQVVVTYKEDVEELPGEDYEGFSCTLELDYSQEAVEKIQNMLIDYTKTYNITFLSDSVLANVDYASIIGDKVSCKSLYFKESNDVISNISICTKEFDSGIDGYLISYMSSDSSKWYEFGIGNRYGLNLLWLNQNISGSLIEDKVISSPSTILNVRFLTRSEVVELLKEIDPSGSYTEDNIDAAMFDFEDLKKFITIEEYN